jgi:hypothetical protein
MRYAELNATRGIFLVRRCSLLVSLQVVHNSNSIADPGSEFFYPGYRIQGQKDSGSRSSSKNESIFNRKNSFEALGSGMFIHDPDPDFDFLPIPDPLVKEAPDPGSATLYIVIFPMQHSSRVGGSGIPAPSLCVQMSPQFPP